jgi:uncharacterized protein
MKPHDPETRKILSALSHGATFFSWLVVSIGVPIAILMISEDPVVKNNAKEVINFHLNLFLYAIIFGVLCFVLIGFPLLVIVILGILSFILPIIAIIKIIDNPDISYRYPFIFRLV